MTALNYELFDALKEAGASDEKASLAARSVASVDQYDQLVTKADLRAAIAELRAELKTDIADLRAELKTDIAELRAEMKSSMNDVIKWVAGIMVTTAVGLVVAMFGMFKWFLHP